MVKFEFWCLEDIHTGNEWPESGDSKSAKTLSTNLPYKLVLNSIGHSLSQFSSWCEREMLANTEPRGDLIATKSKGMYN